jgi:SpoVK/Ycf46/Vps4 family AAA+-type ATPase
LARLRSSWQQTDLTLDPALLRAGRLDRKIEIPLPNEAGRLEVLKIHAASVQKEGEIDFESVVKMSDGLNGADLRNVVTEAGLFAIKDYRDAVNQDDFNKAVRKVAESKKLEGKLGKWTNSNYPYNLECFANPHFSRVREALEKLRRHCIRKGVLHQRRRHRRAKV